MKCRWMEGGLVCVAACARESGWRVRAAVGVLCRSTTPIPQLADAVAGRRQVPIGLSVAAVVL